MVRCCDLLVLIWAAGLQLTSTDVIDKAYSADRDAEHLEDAGDEPYQQSDTGSLHKLQRFIKKKNLEQECTKDATKKAQHLLKEKEEKDKTILRSNYQILQHGEGSLASNKEWLSAIKSEICAGCLVKKICSHPPKFLSKYVSPCV